MAAKFQYFELYFFANIIFFLQYLFYNKDITQLPSIFFSPQNFIHSLYNLLLTGDWCADNINQEQ